MTESLREGVAHAVLIPAPGGPEALKFTQVAMPRPGHGEVLIQVNAAGVNRADIKQRAGDYPMPPDAPNVPGLEIAGLVASIGPGVSGLALGDSVCALVLGGGYAEYCVAPAAQCLPLPRGFDFTTAAALPEALFTVWTALFEQARLQIGDTVLVHGGASGIGTTAIQLVTALGSRILVTAGSEERCALCRSLGAELAINYRQQDFADEVLRHTGGRGVDVVLDMVGGPYAARNIRSLAPYGRLCFIAGDQGAEARFTIREIMLKRISVTGSTLRHRSSEDKGRVAAILRRIVWPLLESGRIRPVIGKVIPLRQAGEAHKLLEAGAVMGKIVLQVR